MNIGQVIYIERKKQNMRQIDLARRVGVTASYISQIENNDKGTRISLTLTGKIAKELSIPLPILLFLSIEETDIREEKVAAYRLIKEPVSSLLKTLL